MKQRIITPNADGHIEEITRFLHQGGSDVARRYYDNVKSSFYTLPETFLPRRASPHLPEYVREISVIGFKGYTLRIAYIEDKIGLVAAFRPGFTDSMKNKYSYNGLRQLKTS